MGQKDILSKQLTLPDRSMIFELLSGRQVSEPLDKSLRVARELHTDNLVRMDDGSILHIEFQSAPDRSMPWRMAQYKFLMLLKEGDRYGKRLPKTRQFVIYIGNSSVGMKSEFIHDKVRVEFELLNIQGAFDEGQIDLLLKSRVPEDRILGLLCLPMPEDRNGEEWKAYIGEWGRVWAWINISKSSQKPDLFALLDIAAALRELPPELMRVEDIMPLQIDIEKTVYIKRVVEEAVEDADRRRLISTIMKLSVNAEQAVDIDAETQLFGLDYKDLEKVYDKVVFDGIHIETALLDIRDAAHGTVIKRSGPSLD